MPTPTSSKTTPNSDSVEQYLASITDASKLADSRALLTMMEQVTGAEPVMWGSSIIGFGHMHYTYASGREGDTMAIGFSARKAALVLYGVVYYEQNIDALQKLGTCRAGKGCLYIKRLSDINVSVLKSMIKTAYANRNMPAV